ncbi:MAG: DUF1028 domain-containing protein [Actinomycetota bacterium]
MTYSIVARDQGSGQMGVAVQSHWFSVGSVVTWTEAGVGAVATQAFAEVSYGPRGLDALREGQSPSDALASLLDADPMSDRRQVAMVDAAGAVVAHTGAMTIQSASHVTGDGFSCQANMMLTDTVPEAMAKAFAAAEGEFVDRLLAALEAAEAEGGDIRGRQSAAISIVAGEKQDGILNRKLLELRVEDHPEPLTEMRRLLTVHRAYESMNEGNAKLVGGDLEGALSCFAAAQDAVPDNVEFSFHPAVTLAATGHIDEAKRVISRTFAASENWRELLSRLPAVGMLEEDTLSKLLS